MKSGEYLSDLQQQQLRSSGLLSESEVALKRGDIIIAVSAVSGQERILGYSKDIIKENKQVLKG